MHSPESKDERDALIEENRRLKARIALLERERDKSGDLSIRRYLSALYRSVADLIKHRSLDTLLHSIVNDMNELVGTAHGVIYLADERGENLTARTATGIFEPYVGVNFLLSEGISGQVYQTGKPIFVDDYQGWNDRDESVLTALKAAVAFPLKIAEKPIGVISLGFLEYSKPLPKRTMDLLQGYANLAAICMENIHIYDELNRTKHFNERVTNIVPATIVIYEILPLSARPIYINDSIQPILGYTRKEVLENSDNVFASLIHPEDIDRVQQHLQVVLGLHDDDVAVQIDYRIKHKDGSWRNFRSWDRVFDRNADGSPTHVLSLGQDVTENRAIQQALIYSESRLRAIFESAAIGMIVSERGGVIQDCNPAFAAMLGYTRDELIGVNGNEISHPKDVRIEVPELQRMVTEKLKQVSVEKRFMRKDGTVMWARVWFSSIPSPNDAPSSAMAIIEDITERRLSEQATLESENRFRVLMETVPAIVFLYQNDALVYINPAADHILGTKDLQTFQAMLVQIIKEQSEDIDSYSQSNDLQLMLENGSVCWLNLSLSIIELEGTPTILGTALDITARKDAEQHEIAFKLEQHRVDLLAEFVAHASHDFRTPLSTIQTSLYLIERLQDEERRQQRIQIIKDQLDHLNRMLDNMLTLTRLDSSAYFQPANTTAYEILSTVKEKAQPATEKKSLLLDVDTDEAQTILFADASLLIDALYELVDNAIRYTAEGGKIKVRCAVEDNHYRFTVTDTGIGIPLDEAGQIFERFYRVDRARRFSGTGLGLAIVKKIAERHEGTVTLDQSTIDVGSTFSLTIPLV
ncbi:MAG: PAS domain S-box protein, partial [Aggregatilineales bacterium]